MSFIILFYIGTLFSLIHSFARLSSSSAAIKQKSELDYHKQMVGRSPTMNQLASAAAAASAVPEMGGGKQSEAGREENGGEGA